MERFKKFIESYDTVQDFLSNPVHNEKSRYEWITDFEKTGGKVIGHGSKGVVYSHPKWEYVVKTFNDIFYIKFVRMVMKNPHKSFPKFYGKPQLVIPPYTRKIDNDDTHHAIRMEKLKPITEEEFNIFKDNYYRYRRLETYDDDIARIPEWRRDTPEYYTNDKKQNTEKLNALPKTMITAYAGLSIIEELLPDAAMDWHKGNFMKRDNGDFVIIDPIWEGGPSPYQAQMDYDRQNNEADYEDTRISVKGGKRFKRPKKKPIKYEPIEISWGKMEGDDIPF